MAKRHEKLGIKQTIQLAWMDKTLQMVLAGLSETEIRSELDIYLSTQKQSGGIGERGKVAYTMAIPVLATWFTPNADLVSFRNDLISIAKEGNIDSWLPLHWAIVCASYPFWFNVAKQTGRLLNLQSQVSQPQIFARLKEQYGDRETVARNARYAVRSLVAWGVISDSVIKGRYERGTTIKIGNIKLATLMYEAMLLSLSSNKSNVDQLYNNPGFFPFELPSLHADYIAKNNNRIDIVRYNLDNHLLFLKD